MATGSLYDQAPRVHFFKDDPKLINKYRHHLAFTPKKGAIRFEETLKNFKKDTEIGPPKERKEVYHNVIQALLRAAGIDQFTPTHELDMDQRILIKQKLDEIPTTQQTEENDPKTPVSNTINPAAVDAKTDDEPYNRVADEKKSPTAAGAKAVPKARRKMDTNTEVGSTYESPAPEKRPKSAYETPDSKTSTEFEVETALQNQKNDRAIHTWHRAVDEHGGGDSEKAGNIVSSSGSEVTEGEEEKQGRAKPAPAPEGSVPHTPARRPGSEAEGASPDGGGGHGVDIEHAHRRDAADPPADGPGGDGGGGGGAPGHVEQGGGRPRGHYSDLRKVDDAKSTGRSPDWGGKVSGPLKKEELAYQMCHPRMCFRFFQKDNYENLMKLMTFSQEDGHMYPNEDGQKECGDPQQAFSANQQILQNYGRTLQIQSLLYDPTKDPNVDPLLICKEYLELHEATRVALKRYMKTTKGDYHQPDGMELGLREFNNQDADGSLLGYKRARSSASESQSFVDNNKFAPKLKRTKLQIRRAPQRLETYTYKWM